MPAFLEAALKRQYGQASAVPYKVMNALGAMHGHKETAKGHAMEQTHAAKGHPHKNLGKYLHPKKSK